MPSPFPGMDPYLENPAHWADVHHSLISASRELLNSQLKPAYYVLIEERVYITDENDEGRMIIPDMRVVSLNKEEKPKQNSSAQRNQIEPVLVTTLLEEEVREAYMKVVHRESRQTVAIIEILSPSNKISGANGRESYEQKRHEVMNSDVHFIEVDLLRDGLRHATMPRADYIVHVSRVDKRPRGLVWPIPLSERLPLIPIPLKKGDKDADLDLQEVLNVAYDRAGYDIIMDYTKDPVPPLPEKYCDWARELLNKKPGTATI